MRINRAGREIYMNEEIFSHSPGNHGLSFSIIKYFGLIDKVEVNFRGKYIADWRF